MADHCTCTLGADECDNGFGVFLPLQDGGGSVVRPCQKYLPPPSLDDRRYRNDFERRPLWLAACVTPCDGGKNG